MQRQHGRGRARGIGGPRGLAWAIGRGGGLEELEQLAGELAQGTAAKPAKLRTCAEIALLFSRLAQAFQHCPSNMPDQARREAQFSAIVAVPGQQLLDPAELELVQVAAGRDRGPKLFARTRTWTLQIAISGL